jgi:hypothetical protein
MPNFVTKNISLYYKTHDGLNLNQGNADELPTSVGPLPYFYKVESSDNLSSIDCDTIYTTISGYATEGGIELPAPSAAELGPGGPGCQNPRWGLSQLAAAGIKLYYDNGLTAEADPGKFSQNPFPAVIYDPADNVDSVVYSYKPPISVTEHISSRDWETYSQLTPTGDTILVLQSRTISPINPSLVEFLSIDGQVYYKPLTSIPCDPSYATQTLSNVSYFPTDEVGPGATLEEIAAAGIPLIDGNVDEITGYFSTSEFPNFSEDVTVYEATSMLNSFIMNWQDPFACTQIVASDETVREITVKYANTIDVGVSVNSQSNLFCSTGNEIRFFYTNNNVEYTSVEELMEAQEPIYVTPYTLSDEVLPEYWQLIDAPEGAYGLDDNRYYVYLLNAPANTTGFSVAGFYTRGVLTDYLLTDTSANSIAVYCEITGLSLNQVKTIDLSYANTQQVYCDINSGNQATSLVTCQYLNPFGENDLTFDEILLNQIPLYVDSQELGAYYGIDELILDSGFYGDQLGFYYSFNKNLATQENNPWKGREFVTISENYSTPFVCGGTVRQITGLISTSILWEYYFPEYNFSNEWCYRQKTSTPTYYYDLHPDLANFTIHEIAQYNIGLRLNIQPSDFIDFASYSDDAGHYYKWVANTDLTGGNWVGLNSSQQESSAFITSPITCNLQPVTNYFDGIADNILTQVGEGPKLAFYIFSSCIPVNGQYTHYIVFGNHTNNNESSFMSEAFENPNMDYSDPNIQQPMPIGSSFYSYESTDLNYGCKKYVGIIYADSPATAELLMSSELNYFQGDIQFVNPITIGILSEKDIYYYENGCDDCLNLVNNPGTKFTLSQFDDGTVDQTAEPKFGLEVNYNLHNNSKPLLRTNPRLTGNIKLITDSKGDIYLESINANKELSDSRYKKYGVSPEGEYSYDVARFFNDNKTPYEMVYETKRNASDKSVLESYDLQYEEDYQCGVSFNDSKMYDENFRIFAPIQIDTNIPKLFVIYRVASPKPNQNYGNGAADKSSRIESMLTNATIVKTFDLSESSKLGKYIRKHVYSEFFQDSQLTVSFEKNEQTFYNGIDLVKGGFSSKGEFIYKDFIDTDKPIIEANDFITDGFKRNRIVTSNILNLEFMFDDNQSSEYSVSRYFGLFVDDIPSGRGKIQRVNSGLIKFKDLTSYMHYDNNEGSTFDGNTFAIPSSQMMRDVPVLGYVKCDTHYHNIKNGAEWEAENYTLRIDDNGDDVNKFTGVKDTRTTVELKENLGVGYDFVKLSINDIPFNGDTISILENKKQSYCIRIINHVPGSIMNMTISYPTSISTSVNSGSNITEAIDNLETEFATNNDLASFVLSRDGNTLFVKESQSYFNDINLEISSLQTPSHVVKVEENYTNLRLTEHLITANSSLDKARCTDREFSNQGTIKDIIAALSGVINRQDGLSTIVNGTDIYVYGDRNIGYARYQHTILVSKSNVVDFISLTNSDTDNKMNVASLVSNDWDVYYMIGGHSDGRSVLISNNSVGGLNIGDYIDSKSTVGYNRVLDIVENINDVGGKYSKVVLKTRHDLGSGEFKVFREYEAEIGLFSAYDIYDMNFDFYDKSNSDLKELKYETYQNTNYVPANEAIFNTTEGEEETALEGIIDADYLKDPNIFFAGLNPVLYPETPVDQEVTNISSEYDRLQENNLKEFTINSRVVPNINKWVLKDVKTVRDQPYYLNVSEAFGRTNFSPDITIEGRDPRAFTHEWFYIVNKPNYLKHFMLNDTFSYINYISGFELTKDMFKSIDNDYFSSFMISEGFDVIVDPDEQQKYVVTFSADTVYINDEAFTTLNMVIGNTYYFNLSNLTDPSLFNIGGTTGTYQLESIGGVDYGVYTTETYGYVQFTYNGILGGNISVSNEDFNKFEAFTKTNRNIKYTLCGGGEESSFASTIFKGLKFEFKNRKEYEKIKPYEFLKDTSFNEYKFSVVVDYKTNQDRNDIEFEVIKNDKFKFIIFYITIRLDEVYVGGTLNRKLSYLLANQLRIEGEEYINDDVRVSGALDLSNIDFNSSGPYTVTGITHFDGSEPDFLTQIAPNADNSYGSLQIDYQINDANGDPIIYNLQIVGVISNNQIIVEGTPTDSNGNQINPVYLPLSLQEFAEYVYVGGGINNHDLLLQNISANNIVSLVNSNDPSITYTTVTKDGEVQANRFAIYIDDGKEIVRASNLIANPDNNKPKSYSLFNGTIGYNLETRNPYYPFLIRHSGKYICDLKPVVTFTDVYSHFKVNRNYVKNAFLEEKIFKDRFYRHPSANIDEISSFGPRRVHKAESYYIKYNRTNVAFNLGFISDDGTHDSDWGIIKNHFYHKVNEDTSSGVTKLSESGEALPLYPIIGEIAIDKRDLNVFRSSWEKDYYRTALAGGESVASPGTFSTKESRSYLSSTVMKLRESYTLTSFTIQNANTFKNLDSIRKNNSYEANVVFAEDSEKVYIDFYMSDLISDMLSVAGVASEIQKYVDAASSFQDKTDLTDDVRSYVNSNLVNLFSVDEVEIYTRKTKNTSTLINSVESLDLINNGGFELDINYTIEQHARRPINFRLIYNKSLGYSHIIRPVIKIKQ